MLREGAVKIRSIGLIVCILCYVGSSFSAETPNKVIKDNPNSKKDQIRGIYINSGMAMNTKNLQSLAKKALAVGINTFIVDYVPRSKRYQTNVKWIESQGIQYIPRIIMYPGGGTHEQLTSQSYFNQKMATINAAVDLGAKEVQLDYIRYHSRGEPLKRNAEIVAGVLEQIKQRLHHRDVRLQIDIFGIASHGPSHRIGQDVRLMAAHVDAICPMVYPSHYEPYREHSENPYRTISNSLNALVAQLQGHGEHVSIYPYIEAYNYRYPMNTTQRIAYIREQLRAARESATNGWMVWSAKNAYDNLFAALS
jgi:hypothetical protein